MLRTREAPMTRATALLCLVLAAGCGGGVTVAGPGTPTATALATALATVPATVPAGPTPDPIPSFVTPEEAMRYLAEAWNSHDLVALKHVTDPAARDDLEYMRREAVDLRLDHCTRNDERRDYDCTFTHGFPPGYTGHSHEAGYAEAVTPGTATVVVGPASRSGWYMTVLESCG